MARLQLVNRAADLMPALVTASGATALLAVWSNAGPVIVRWERAARYAVTSLGLGSVLPLTRSATGHVFLALLPARLTAPVLALEPQAAPAPAALAAAVRRAGHATVDGRLIPGLVAASVPVLNWQDEAEAAITLIGTEPALLDPGGPALAALRPHRRRGLGRRPAASRGTPLARLPQGGAHAAWSNRHAAGPRRPGLPARRWDRPAAAPARHLRGRLQPSGRAR